MKDFSVRKASPKDFPAIQHLNHQSFLDAHERGDDDVLDLDWPYSKAGVAYYTKALTDAAWAAFVACDTHGAVVGYVIGSSENKFSYRTVVTGELNDMFVVPEERRKGIANRLAQVLKTWMKEKGVDRIYVSVFAKNKRALAFYEAVGFSAWEMGLEMGG